MAPPRCVIVVVGVGVDVVALVVVVPLSVVGCNWNSSSSEGRTTSQVVLLSSDSRKVKTVEESRTGSLSVQSSIVSGVVDRKDGNERIDGFGKWLTYIYTLRMAGDIPIWHASGHIIVKPDHVIT